MMTANVKTRRGSCLCGAIQYTVTGEPLTFFVCHCVNCRKATGAAFMANAIFKREQIEQTEGHEHIRRFRDTETGSGEVLNRFFCGSCGANVFLEGDKGDYKIVATGTLNEEAGWVPRHEKFAGGKRPWIEGIKTRSSKL